MYCVLFQTHMLNKLAAPRWLWLTLALLVALLLLPLAAPLFYIYIISVIFVTALLAMSLNLVLGYGGIYQFHHAVFYGVGAYTATLLITQLAMPTWLAFAAGPVVAAFIGLLIGWFCVRLTKLYFGMLQIALGSLVWVIAYRWYDVTGGDNGIHDIPMPEFLMSFQGAYYFILIITAVCVALMYFILKSPFGATLQAIRDNPERCEAIGVNVRQHQLIAIVIASFFGGVAGVMFVALERSVFPGLLFWVLSLEILVMCLLGGWFTFAGPILGAAIVVALRTVASRYTDYWTTILGIALILLIFFLPEGVMGWARERFKPRVPKADQGGAS